MHILCLAKKEHGAQKEKVNNSNQSIECENISHFIVVVVVVDVNFMRREIQNEIIFWFGENWTFVLLAFSVRIDTV